MILNKSMATGMMNRMLRFKVRKLEQWEALLVSRTENPSMPDQTYEILVFTIGGATTMTGEGAVSVINLF